MSKNKTGITASTDVVFDAQATGKVAPDAFAREKAERQLGAMLFALGAVTLAKGEDPTTGYAKYTYSVEVAK